MGVEEVGIKPHIDLCLVPEHFKIPWGWRRHAWGGEHIPLNHHSVHGSSSDFMHDPNSHSDEVNGEKNHPVTVDQ